MSIQLYVGIDALSRIIRGPILLVVCDDPSERYVYRSNLLLTHLHVKNDGSSDEAKLEWYDGGPWDKVFLWLFEDGNEWVQIAERVHGTEDGFLLALDDGREEWFENSELPLEVCRELRRSRRPFPDCRGH